ncbi:MAG TPA: hypothetical protein PLK12_16665, partial [Prolixibacteraceae bacterium]|nr:hypothetical protein [Prolixibacteraceae bacterium]
MIRPFASMAEGYDSIQVIEYFIDVDPGAGNGTILETDSTPAYVANDRIDVSALSEGIHTLWFRAQDSTGLWGAPFGKSFYVYQPLETDTADIPLEKLEYSFNNHDGFTEVEAIGKDTAATAAGTIDINSLSTGIHTIWFRTEDSTGFYGAPFGKSFYVYQPLETDTADIPLEKLEYSFNNHDGFTEVEAIGKDTAATAAGTIDINSLSTGIHTIWFRTEDSTGFYGAPFGKSFYVYQPLETDTANIPLEKLEYAFDSHDGFALVEEIGNDTAATASANIDIQSLSPGIHTLYFRAEDSTGFYGAPYGKSFYVYQKTRADSANVPVTDIEFSFDSISGFTPITAFDPDTAVTALNDLLATLVGHGRHTISFRAKDAHHFYSAVLTDT